MTHSEFGDKQGRLVVYFHGVPGSLDECSQFARLAEQNRLRVICLDRFAVSKTLQGEAYFQQLVEYIKAQAKDKSVSLIGFSIGSFIALQVAMRMQHQVEQLHLISAAGTINVPDRLNQMAGGPVFKLAKHTPVGFRLLCYYQKFMAAAAPSLLFNMLFTSAQGEDRHLAQQQDFKAKLCSILQRCFKIGMAGYIRDIELYVNWQGEISDITAQSFLWHGSKDNWSPPDMAIELQKAAGNETQLTMLEGLSHYSCLQTAMPMIFSSLSHKKEHN